MCQNFARFSPEGSQKNTTQQLFAPPPPPARHTRSVCAWMAERITRGRWGVHRYGASFVEHPGCGHVDVAGRVQRLSRTHDALALLLGTTAVVTTWNIPCELLWCTKTPFPARYFLHSAFTTVMYCTMHPDSRNLITSGSRGRGREPFDWRERERTAKSRRIQNKELLCPLPALTS